MQNVPHDKVALVTGAGSGIGAACAQALLRDGWRVVFAGRRLPALEQAIAAAGDPWGDIDARALAVSADVSDAAAVQRLFDTLQQRFGRLDLLFNNAGVFTPATPVDELPLEQWQAAVNVNLHGPFLCTQHAFRLMKAQSPRGGRIINNGSISAHAPRPFSVPYTTTKHAITGLTRAAALEGRAFDIAVGQIDIGNVATDMTERMAAGVLQADGSVRPEARMGMDAVTSTFLAMARLPLEANVLTMTVMATGMPYVGRG
ncbi:SDR family oxidoreductase [Azohydromonas aeria]|uniref:SDR family oxidoreductase n=1 Tax=Azohydromonas aeria TaxID=2590212 RepID=UPI0012F9BAF7|nr:SDR family oxidoreductase [Azohydromonas aeria]